MERRSGSLRNYIMYVAHTEIWLWKSGVFWSGMGLVSSILFNHSMIIPRPMLLCLTTGRGVMYSFLEGRLQRPVKTRMCMGGSRPLIVKHSTGINIVMWKQPFSATVKWAHPFQPKRNEVFSGFAKLVELNGKTFFSSYWCFWGRESVCDCITRQH